MNLKSRLAKLEEAAASFNKPVLEMTSAELEQFLCHYYGLPKGTKITDEMLEDMIKDEKVKLSKYTHEEALEFLD